MRKILFPLLLLCFIAVAVYAQPRVEKSAPIEEPAIGSYDKVLLMKSGKTCYAHYSGDGAIDLNIYGTDRKLASHTAIKSQRWDGDDFKSTTILGTYDINGELVIFLQQTDKKHPVLYRLRINTDDGKLLKEDILATTKKGNSFFAKDNVQTQMKVAKDTKSGCYAVVFYDNLDEDADDAIKVMHFDEKHTLLSTARISSPDKKIRHIVIQDIAVEGNKSVYLATYYVGNSEEESKIYISKLSAGETAVTTKSLDFTEDFRGSNLQMAYNYTTGQVQLLIVAYTKTKRNKEYYVSYFCNINPATLDVAGVKEVSNEKVTAFARNSLGAEGDGDYMGVPQCFVLNSRNEPVIIKQVLVMIYHTTSKGATYRAGTAFGSIGISEMANDGSEKQSYLVKHTSATRMDLGAMYIKDINTGKWDNAFISRKMGTNIQFHSFRYVIGKKNNYIIHLAHKKEIDNPDNDKMHKKDFAESKNNAAYCTMRNGNISNDFLFGKPVGKKDKTTCFMDAADQNDDGLFATIIIEQKGKKTEHKIAWVSFE